MPHTPLPFGSRSATFALAPHRWAVSGVEPALCDILADPLVHLVMRRDGVTPAALRAVLTGARTRLGAGQPDEPLCPCLAA